MNRNSFQNIAVGMLISLILLSASGHCQSVNPYQAIDQNRANEILDMIKNLPEEKVKPIIEPLVKYLQSPDQDFHTEVIIAYVISRYNNRFLNTKDLPVLIEWIESVDFAGKPDDDLDWMYRALNNTGVLLKDISRLAESQSTYLKAIAVLRSMTRPDKLGIGSLYLNLATVRKQAGEYNSALEYLQQAMLIFNDCIKDSTLSQKANINKAKLLNNKGLVYQNLFNHEAAIEAFYKSIEMIKEFNITDEDMVYTNLSNSLIELNRFVEAREVLDIVLNKRADAEPDDRIRFLAMINKAQLIQLADKDELKALAELASMARIIEGQANPPLDLLVETKLLEGDLLRSTGNYSEALLRTREVLKLIATGPGDADIENAPENIRSLNTLDLINLLLLTSRIYRDMGEESGQIDYIRLAMRNYAATANLIDSTRGTLLQSSSQIELSRRQESSFDEMISVAYTLYLRTLDRDDLKNLFEFIEISKSAGLWRAMSDSETKSGIILAEDLSLEKEIDIKLSEVQGYLARQSASSAKNIELIKELEAESFRLNIKKDSLIRTYETKYPDYYRSKFDRSVISLDQTAASLRENEVMLQYSMTAEAIICIAVSRPESQVFMIPLDSLTMARTDFLINYMKGGYSTYNGSEMRSFYEASSGLYSILIQPFEGMIENKELIIIPDGLLNYISFDALIKPSGKAVKHDFHSYEYLIREHIVSYGFTATLYQFHPVHKKEATRSILAVAPVYKPARIQSIEFLRNKGDALPQLSGTLKEARSARESIGGRLLIKNGAREGTFKNICSDYTILHLAMHTLTDREKPMNSCLVFTPGSDKTEDGCLFSHEIYNLSLNSNLVVLSACETGSGELAAGEGIMSLGRAFLFAGCPVIIMTLWTVDDKSSEKIMSGFYSNLIKDQPIAAALRNSKLAYLAAADQLQAHPRFWAAVLPVGQNLTLDFPKPKSYAILWLLLIPVSLFGLFVTQWKKKSPPKAGI
ncbi:MAG: hypothetical protein A2X22_04510 [Bacteroidetes bacterium GWF2_49_14]|nr:MAG: hypothetical protein A2X22_04510 [Bacteroidetes bacterium GWF2_49_14]